ncbi:MAG: TonB-dependent receptor [Opitutales bacterium]
MQFSCFRRLAALSGLLLPLSIQAEEEMPVAQLPPITLSPQTRAAASPSESLVDPAQAEPFALDLTEALDDEPAFQIYRREGARQANPTAQGVSLRNLGPTATSRTLVLRNGVPQNDPFGGWIPWVRFPAMGLEQVTFLAPGEGLPWGSGSAGGVLLLEPKSPAGTAATADLAAGVPAFFRGYTRATGRSGPWRAGAEVFGSVQRGHFRVHPSDRGPVDTRAHLRYFGANGTVVRDDRAGRWELAAGVFDEARGNGLPQSENATFAADVALRRVWEPVAADWSLTAVGYGQFREFESSFAAVNDDRTEDSPVLDQFSVPAESGGGALTLALALAPAWELLLGADARWIAGETNERFFFSGSEFLRQREAGGNQLFGGAFATLRWSQEPFAVQATGRLDYWRLSDGRLLVSDLSGGSAGSTTRFDDRDGLEPTGQVSAQWRPVNALLLRAAVSRNFRVPTINELYRPFRVGNDTTRANAALEPERFTSAFVSARARPAERLEIFVEGFHYWLEEAVANVTLETFPDGSTAQRLNVPESRVFGLETGGARTPLPDLRLQVAYLFAETRFESATQGIDLDGRAFPLAPKHALTAEVAYERGGWRFVVEKHYTGEAFEDTDNSREIPDAFTVDVGAAYAIGEGMTLRCAVDNLFDATVVSGVRADGTRFVAPGRTVSFGFRWEL